MGGIPFPDSNRTIRVVPVLGEERPGVWGTDTLSSPPPLVYRLKVTNEVPRKKFNIFVRNVNLDTLTKLNLVKITFVILRKGYYYS